MEVTRVVSLGARCATAYHLRRFFNHADGGLFDWWITPPQALIAVLRNLTPDFIYGDPAALVRINENDTVLHTRSGLHLHHEFPRVGSNKGPVADSYLDHVGKAHERTAYLMKKFRDLNRPDEAILFIREREVDEVLLREQLEQLFDRAEWHLVILPSASRERPGDPWYGSVDVWDAELSALGYRLNNPALKKFGDPHAEDTGQEIVAQ